eukprot:NODE_57_length_28844_cov_0.352687.p12 type:complete len:281 gc:universal NODE_57_length_28844_cov_0.352687:9285-8443(-)
MQADDQAAYNSLVEVLKGIQYQKDILKQSIEYLHSLRADMENLNVEEIANKIKEIKLPDRHSNLYTIDSVLANLTPELVKKYSMKYLDKDGNVKAPKTKIRINWTNEEAELFEKTLLAQFPIGTNHKQRLGQIAKHLPSKSKKQIQVKLNKFYMKLVKENKPLVGARYSLATSEKKRGRPSKMLGISTVSFSDNQKNEVPVNHDLIHYGFMCEICNIDPIIGVRYHCSKCNVDACETCSQEEHQKHISHPWVRYNDATHSAIPDEFAYLKGIWGGNKIVN